MDLPETLCCVFTAEITERDDAYVVEIPKREVTTGPLQPNAIYRLAITEQSTGTEANPHATAAASPTETPISHPEPAAHAPPVEEGEIHEVEIEDIGEQGDGIARVERGFVVIVPETETGERVTIEITNVNENVAFGEVAERQTHVQ